MPAAACGGRRSGDPNDLRPLQHPSDRAPRRRRARTTVVAGLAAASVPAVAAADWTDIGEVFPDTYTTSPGTQGVPLAVNPRGDIAAAINPNGAGSSVTLSRRPVGGTFALTAGAVAGRPSTAWRPADLFTPTTAIAPDGSALAAWKARSDVDGGLPVVAASSGPTGWSAAQPFDLLPRTHGVELGDPDLFRLKALSGGSFLAVWRPYEETDGGVEAPLLASVRSPDGTWGPVRRLAVGGKRILDVLVDRDGNATVVWIDGMPTRNNSRTEGFRSQRRLADGTWQAVRTFGADRISANADAIFTVDGYGNVIVAYTGSDDPPYTQKPRTKLLKVATLKPGHDWSATQNIAAATGDPDATTSWGLASPNLTATQFGSVLLTYSDGATGVLHGILGDSEQHWGAPFQIAGAEDHVGGVRPVEHPVQRSISMVYAVLSENGPTRSVARDVYPWDGTLSEPYAVPTYDGGTVSGQIATTERGDTIVPYQGYGHLRVLVDDASGPALTGLQVPSGLAPKATGTLAVTATDAYSKVGRITWDFGDGTSARGSRVTHAWKAAGTYRVSVTAVDQHGNPSTATSVVRVGGAAATTRAKAPRGGGPVRVSKVRIRKGLLTFDTSGPAALIVAIQRRSVERVRVKGKVRRVARYTPVGATQVDAGVAGPVSARVAALKRARGYRLIVSRRGQAGAVVRSAIVER